jgi:hypothetical protein
MMNDNDTSVIETKFLRCSKCRSYSVKQSELNAIEKVKGFFFPAAAYYCANCSHRFVEYGSFSPGLKKLLHQHKWLLALPLVLVALVIIILLFPGDKSVQPPTSTPYSEPPAKKREVPSTVDQMDRSIETKKTGKVTTEEKTKPKPTQKGAGEKEKLEVGAATSPVILKKTESISISTSIKVFSASTIKIRSSAPNTVGPANRWCFLRKTITVKREALQHAYIAGDSTGTQKWGVDDQLIINGKVYEGLSTSYNNKGGPLPESAKHLPLDITDLVPANQETPLRIELVDHGEFWANTEIYIVIK